ncbi:hypothetical protein ACWGE0_36265 [Lentzea sp. NPDC054927]
MTFSALDDVLRGAASVRVSEIEWHGETLVDLSRAEDRDRTGWRNTACPAQGCHRPNDRNGWPGARPVSASRPTRTCPDWF